jgi:hypothetical protein
VVISRRVPYSSEVDASYFNGNRTWVSGLWMKNVISCLPATKDSEVQIAIDFEKPAMNFSILNEDAVHIVYSRLKD